MNVKKLESYLKRTKSRWFIKQSNKMVKDSFGLPKKFVKTIKQASTYLKQDGKILKIN